MTTVAPTELAARVREHRDHVLDVGPDRRLGLPANSRSDLLLAAVLETEQLVRVAMLLVVIDQARDTAAT